MSNCVLDADTLSRRPKLPKRAVVTGGMPYGNKELHFGHIGGVFVQADTFARFLRDRLGSQNVLFVSGTDCYGSPIQVGYRQMVESGAFEGTLTEFVEKNHRIQKQTLEKYLISTDLFAASAFGPAKEIHEAVSAHIFTALRQNGHLKKISTRQFYDTGRQVFLNGRQVVGRCPIQNCQSAKAYADECELGHQYTPAELIAPRSVLSGEVPEMRQVENWYLDLPKFRPFIQQWVDRLKEIPGFRKFIISTIEEFLKPPVAYVKNEEREAYEGLKAALPAHTLEEGKTSFTLAFATLPQRDEACALLTQNGVRYRTGKTLVPFRLTGNAEWGVPAPDCEGTKGLTFWVWPESLWAPISFTMACLSVRGEGEDAWKKWWCSEDAVVYQFIGSDNISFYGPSEAGLWMGLQGAQPASQPPDGALSLPYLVANNHILFLNKKASSSGEIKPPMALELLDLYTPEQLRAHFLGLGLGMKSVSFMPKPLNPAAEEGEADPVLKEGNLLTNVFNRVLRSCFYTAQTYYGGLLPQGEIDDEVLLLAQMTALDYERHMCAHEFHAVMNLLDGYIRGINKYWVARMRQADSSGDDALRKDTLVNVFHMVRTAAVLAHPVAPQGTEMLLEYLGFGEEFWSWDRIFDTVYDFMPDPACYRLKTLEPRTDFFAKHESQFTG